MRRHELGDLPRSVAVQVGSVTDEPCAPAAVPIAICMGLEGDGKATA